MYEMASKTKEQFWGLGENVIKPSFTSHLLILNV